MHLYLIMGKKSINIQLYVMTIMLNFLGPRLLLAVGSHWDSREEEPNVPVAGDNCAISCFMNEKVLSNCDFLIA